MSNTYKTRRKGRINRKPVCGWARRPNHRIIAPAKQILPRENKGIGETLCRQSPEAITPIIPMPTAHDAAPGKEKVGIRRRYPIKPMASRKVERRIATRRFPTAKRMTLSVKKREKNSASNLQR